MRVEDRPSLASSRTARGSSAGPPGNPGRFSSTRPLRLFLLGLFAFLALFALVIFAFLALCALVLFALLALCALVLFALLALFALVPCAFRAFLGVDDRLLT